MTVKSIKFNIFSLLVYIGFAYPQTHTVVEGETLSEILHKNAVTPIYGNRGSLKKVIELNPHIVSPHSIYPEQVIILKPKEDELNRSISEVVNVDHVSLGKASSLRVNSEFGFARLDTDLSGGTSASALSGIGTGFDVEWSVPFSDKANLHLFAGHMSYDFSVSSNKSLSGKTSAITRFGFGADYKLWDSIGLDFGIGFQSSPVLIAKDSESLFIDDVGGAFSLLTVVYDVWAEGNHSLNLSLPVSYLFEGEGVDINTDGGVGYGLSLNLSSQLSSGRMFGGVGYNIQNNRFDSANVRNQFFTFNFGYEFFIGEVK
jgi:hypothetical protein